MLGIEQNMFTYLQYIIARTVTEKLYHKRIHFKVEKEPLLKLLYDWHPRLIKK